MTPDYSTLDTAALVAAADEALKGVTPGEWMWWTEGGNGPLVGIEAKGEDGETVEVLSTSLEPISIDDDAAAFIAAAPALVRALVARLRECENG